MMQDSKSLILCQHDSQPEGHVTCRLCTKAAAAVHWSGRLLQVNAGPSRPWKQVILDTKLHQETVDEPENNIHKTTCTMAHGVALHADDKPGITCTPPCATQSSQTHVHV